MTRCNELRLVLTIFTSLLLGMQANVTTDIYEYDGKTVVPKRVTGCQDAETGILLNSIKISKQSKEIALLPQGINKTGQLELWTEFMNRCNGKTQCQMNQMQFLKNITDTALPSSETNTIIEMEFKCKPIGGENVYLIDTNFSKDVNKVGNFSVYLIYNETSENRVECHVTAEIENINVEILHFEWIPCDCQNSKDMIYLNSQNFNCSWTKSKKAITVQNHQQISIKFLKQSGFVWLKVLTEVSDRSNKQLNLKCDIEPSTTSSSASVSILTRDNTDTTTTRSHQTTLNTMNISTQSSESTTGTSSTTPAIATNMLITTTNISIDTTNRPITIKTTITTNTSITTNTPPMVTLTTIDIGTAPVTTSNISSLSSAPDKSKDTDTLVHIAIGVGITAFLVLILVIALCVIYLRQRKREELSINPKRNSIDGVLVMKEDYAASMYTQVDINQGSTFKETDQLPKSPEAASPHSICKSNTFNETQFPNAEYATVNIVNATPKKSSLNETELPNVEYATVNKVNEMPKKSSLNESQLPNAEYATVNKVTSMPKKSSLNESQLPNAEYATVNKVNATPKKSSLNETEFPNTEYASVNKVNKSSDPVLEPSNTNESNFSNQESTVENKEIKSPLPKSVQNKSSTLPNYTNVETPYTETPESLYSHLSMKSVNVRESENIYDG